MKLFPEGTMTKIGAGGAVLTQVVVFVLHNVGIGECTPDMVAAMPTCIGATEIAGALITAGFGIVAWLGRNRAEKTHAAALAATAQASADAGTPVVVSKPASP